jgi:hypothetical protein
VPQQGEVFGLETGKRREGAHWRRRNGVTNREGARIDQAHHVAAVGLIDDLTILAKETHRPGQPDLLPHAGVPGIHIALEPTGDNA